MGYKLRRALREALGSGITGLQRAVALEIADDAKDDTRTSWARLEDLARWTGAKDSAVVRNALKRLASSGWEFRIPIGVAEKDGRVMYAKPGIRMTFRVPHFEGGATAAPTEGATAPPQGRATAPPHAPQGVAMAHSEGAGATPYFSCPSSPREEEALAAPPIDMKLFGDFWLTYPKSRDRDATLTAWCSALDAGADPHEVVAAARAYAHEKAGEEFRFIKNSANWLSQRRYEDDYAPVPRHAPSPADAEIRDRQQQASDDMFDRAMARAHARRTAREAREVTTP
ncbi:hypothetical protein ACFQLX_21810 [Streptomyces polyrhachis]|uniref:Helix-turn-helix domain-containing protein n=1 Tax=Streptomyces polyrhachis TaxID=1282885 RepID=A0ABW2GMH0_9ACTN